MSEKAARTHQRPESNRDRKTNTHTCARLALTHTHTTRDEHGKKMADARRRTAQPRLPPSYGPTTSFLLCDNDMHNLSGPWSRVSEHGRIAWVEIPIGFRLPFSSVICSLQLSNTHAHTHSCTLCRCGAARRAAPLYHALIIIIYIGALAWTRCWSGSRTTGGSVWVYLWVCVSVFVGAEVR